MGNSSSDDDSDHGLTFNDKGSARLQGDDPVDIQGPAKDQWKLYISHFLSTWNSRVFEFGAVLFLAVGFPQTLIPASIYALFRSASVILFSSWLGHLVDHSNRLQLIKITIVGQRASVATSCVLLYLMTFSASGHRTPAWILLAVLSLLACVEKLCSVINTISVERDWVVVISGGSDQELQAMNSQMRRIDLFCKLVGPLVIALVDGISTKTAVATILGLTTISLPVEYLLIAKVYDGVSALRSQHPPAQLETDGTAPTERPTIWKQFKQKSTGCYSEVVYFARHPAFLPSFSLSLLYLTVLQFGGQMITYLIAQGFNSTSIGLLRTISAVCELSATWAAPKLMARINATRAGIWFLNWQIAWVAISALALWVNINPSASAALLVAGVCVSRIGLWGFDLSAQFLIQEEVRHTERGRFSAFEASLQNFFELLSYASTIAFARPDQFRYPAAISAVAVAIAGACYALFVRERRGHLLHASRCMKKRHPKTRLPQHRHGSEWIELPQHDPRDDSPALQEDSQGLTISSGMLNNDGER